MLLVPLNIAPNSVPYKRSFSGVEIVGRPSGGCDGAFSLDGAAVAVRGAWWSFAAKVADILRQCVHRLSDDLKVANEPAFTPCHVSGRNSQAVRRFGVQGAANYVVIIP